MSQASKDEIKRNLEPRMRACTKIVRKQEEKED